MADVEETSRLRRFCDNILQFFKKYLLIILLILGVCLGIIFGIALRTIHMKPNTKHYVGFMGDILIQALKSVAVPVMVGAIISNIGMLDIRTSGKISMRILLYLIGSKFVAFILSVSLCLIVRPGDTVQGKSHNETISILEKKTSHRAVDKFLDIGRNLLPENWIDMFVNHYETQMINKTENYPDFIVVSALGPNLLGIVVVSFLIGVGLSKLGEEGTPLTSLFSSITKMSMIVTKWFIWIAPIGILFIICREILKAEDILDSIITLGKFMGCLYTCCIVQLVVIHPLIYFIFTRRNPFKIFVNCSQSMVIALATASSYGTMPVAMKELIENQKLSEQTVNVVIPIGITINKDGAFYMYVIGCLFEAQRTDRSTGIDLILIVFILALTTSMATAAVPYEGMILLIMMWSTMDFKNIEKDVGLLFMVDFIGDRVRTILNVFCNVFCASLLDTFNMFEDDQTAP